MRCPGKRKTARSRTAKTAPRARGLAASSGQQARRRKAQKVGDIENREKIIEVTLTLRGPDLPTADELGSPTFSTKRFAAGSASIAMWIKCRRCCGLGLTIAGVSLITRSMRVRGSITTMEDVFHPNLATYKTKDQPEFRDREGKYKVPASLHGIITAVLGFGERRVAQRKPARINATASAAHPNRPFTPADIESHYHFPPGDAAGQTIAIAEFGGG